MYCNSCTCKPGSRRQGTGYQKVYFNFSLSQWLRSVRYHESVIISTTGVMYWLEHCWELPLLL